MAKLIFPAAALLLLFAFAHARTPSDIPNGLDATHNIPVSDAKSAKPTTKTLLLPSERPGSESQTVVEFDPEAFLEEQKLPEAGEEAAGFATIESNEENTADASKSETVPLTVISFRPIGGRRFPRRPFPLPYRHSHRCRHGHRRQWSLRLHGGEREKDTPLRDDMILSSGEEMKLDRPSRGGGVRQIPASWVNYGHGGPRFPFKRDDDVESERPRRLHRRHRHHDHEFDLVNEGEDHHREHKHGHEHRHEHGHGLFKNIRKFLNRF